jgi:hypothetical protein
MSAGEWWLEDDMTGEGPTLLKHRAAEDDAGRASAVDLGA